MCFIFFCFSSYLLVLMEEHSIEDRFAFIEANLELLLHKLDQRIHNDSLMEQGVLPYQGSSNSLIGVVVMSIRTINEPLVYGQY